MIMHILIHVFSQYSSAHKRLIEQGEMVPNYNFTLCSGHMAVDIMLTKDTSSYATNTLQDNQLNAAM